MDPLDLSDRILHFLKAIVDLNGNAYNLRMRNLFFYLSWKQSGTLVVSICFIQILLAGILHISEVYRTFFLKVCLTTLAFFIFQSLDLISVQYYVH